MATKKGHISSFSKYTGSKGCTKPQEFYQIKVSCLIKSLKKYQWGFFQTEPHHRDQVRYQESYIIRKLFHNEPVMQFRPT